MQRSWKRRLGLATLALTPLLLLASTFCSSPLPEPAPLSLPMAAATPPREMALVRLTTGVIRRNAAVAYRGGSFFDRRDFAMTAVLVKHPQGDVLVDTGFGRGIDAQFRKMPMLFRATTRYERGRSAAEQLQAAGYDSRRLRGIILTHAHWDHVSGLPDFPDVPVLISAEERRFIEDGGWITDVARDMSAARYEELSFEGGAYLGFPASHDVHGDGSIVVVPAPGHTPGSVIVFVALPSGSRYAFVGDLVWQREGITLREERPWLIRTLADRDPTELRASLLRMSAIARRFPDLSIVPAHDARAFASLPAP